MAGNSHNGGVFGKAWRGDRTDNTTDRGDAYVETTYNTTELGFGSENQTSMAWVYWEGHLGGGGDNEDYMVFANDTTASIHYGIRANGADVNVDNVHFGTWGGDINDAGTVPPNTWTHVTWVWNSPTENTVYVNGGGGWR